MSALVVYSDPWNGCRVRLRAAAAPALALLVFGTSVTHAWADTAPTDFFEKNIRPVLVEHCYKCHGGEGEKIKGGLRVTTREGLLKGGESGKPAVVAGDPERSLLIEAIRHTNPDLKMPPKERLSEKQVGDFVTWIRTGAFDPGGGEPAAKAATIAEKAAKHWAFQPVKRPTPPLVRNVRWPQTPVDNFVLATLEQHGLTPARPADRRALIRRVYYDLIGLPPTFAAVEAFVHDHSKNAFAKVVDELLASPRYGERWGRHWLDVARYADTKGYVYGDREEGRFVHSHTYRDWVIRSLNNDLPYDRFLALQLAADQMVPADDHADLAAMGYLTLGRRFLGVMHDIIDDRIDVVGRGMQGLTVSCARCHDHKFDPIPTKDYYSLYGVFFASRERTTPTRLNPEPTKAYEEFAKEFSARTNKLEQTFQAKRESMSDRLRAKVADYFEAVIDADKLPTDDFYEIRGADDLIPTIARQWQAYLYQAGKSFHPVFAPWNALAALPARDFAARVPEVLEQVLATNGSTNLLVNPIVAKALRDTPPKSLREAAKLYGKLLADADQAWRALLKGATNQPAASRPVALADPAQEQLRQVLYSPDSPATVPNGAIVDIEWFFEEATRVELSKLQLEIDRWLIQSAGAPPYAVILEDRPTQKLPRVFKRGNPAMKGDEVPRQYLSLVTGPGRQPFQNGSGRLDLARAIASRDNPLTARVMVNRVWQQHFGAGLVKTTSDFGTRSEPPSHPELLDWLASWFMDNGWSLKKLHRMLVLSATYQQTSAESGDVGTPGVAMAHRAVAVDPENRWLWHMNRQRLDFESARDGMLAVAGELNLAAGGRAVELFKPPFATRRTIYGYIDRQFLPGIFRVFDFANPDMHAPQRAETTVPQQALFLMNNDFLADRARAALATASGTNSIAPDARIRQLYERLFQREPTIRQVESAREFVAVAGAEPPPEAPKAVPSAWSYGFGEFDALAKRVKTFTPLPHFADDAWQGGAAWPDEKLGWVRLTAEGGHAGNDLQHAAVRRWTAPTNLVVSLSGVIKHEHKEGDGIVARILSSRHGLLGEWPLHNTKQETKVENLDVQAGDTIDFVVDYRANLNDDDFRWSPVIKARADGAKAAAMDGKTEWNAKQEFAGLPPVAPVPLNAWEQLAQVLLLSNEFFFVD